MTRPDSIGALVRAARAATSPRLEHQIAAMLAACGRPDIPAGVPIAYLLLNFGGTSHLSMDAIARDLRDVAIACYDADPAASLRLAESYGYQQEPRT